MRKLAFLLLMALVPVGNSCSRSLHGGTDAALDGAALDPGVRDAKDTDMSVTNTGGAAGGATGTGGTIAISSAGASGGSTSTGGAATTNSTHTGGASAAGTTSMGGTSAAGGTSASGGTGASGGTSATGGTSAKGGVTATGGASASGGTTGTGGSRPLADGGSCPDIAGNWNLTGSCMGPRAGFNGSFIAVLTQTGCNLLFTQVDDQGVLWTCTGRLENTGRGSLQGKFAFTDSSMCDIVLTDDGLDMRCASATQSCTLRGREVP